MRRKQMISVLALSSAATVGILLLFAAGHLATRATASSPTGGDMANVGTAPARQLWHCGMHPQVIEEHPGDCPICHMPLTPMIPSDASASASRAQRKVLYWWDPMLGPSSISSHPGKSAMGMDMVPVYAEASAGGPEVTIDPSVVQYMGVQTAPVTRGPLHVTVRAMGLLKLPEPGMHDVSLKVGGWIDKLHADQEGMHVSKGDPLFALYSPEMQVAEQELISAARSRRSLGPDASETLRNEAQDLIDSARRKLASWDVDEQEIDAIARADRPPRDVIFHSPATGHLEEKAVVQGSAVQPGMRLMRIADHARMWLDAEVYEQQIPLIQLGQTVEATLEALPGRTFTGRVTFIYPHVEHMTRTLTVRATFDNPDFALKPGMYAEANVITEPVPDATQAPREAVIDTGTRQIAFVAEGDGHFNPRAVRAGIRGDDDRLQIVEGLAVGEQVVTSGQFLMDVESRTNEAIAKLRGEPEPTPAPPATQPTRPMATSEPTERMSPAETDSTTRPSSIDRPAMSLVYCPMAKAQWIQAAGPVDNPYMGPDMKTCGEVRAELAAPAASSPLGSVVDAYLSLQHAMADGRLDPAAARRLKAAVDSLRGEANAGVRAAADQFAAARDLPAARARFNALTDALNAALKARPVR